MSSVTEASLAESFLDLGSPYPQRLDHPQGGGEDLQRIVSTLVEIGSRPFRRHTAKRVVRLVQRRVRDLREIDDDSLFDLVASRRRGPRSKTFPRSATVESLALIHETARRTLAIDLSHSQWKAAWVALSGGVAELGEGDVQGKSTALVMAAIAAALAGHAVHFYSLDDHAAKEVYDRYGPLYEACGLSAALLAEDMGPMARKTAYRQDIVHGTLRQIATDYLKDTRRIGAATNDLRLRVAQLCGGDLHPGALFLRGLQFALVDDADYLLTDEAIRNVGLHGESDYFDEGQMAVEALALAKKLKAHADFLIDHSKREIDLTEQGRIRVRHLSEELGGLWAAERHGTEAILLALQALNLFRAGEHYEIRGNAVVGLDEETKKSLNDRSPIVALSTLLLSKEKKGPADRLQVIGRITCQDIFKNYLRLGGVMNSAPELVGEFRNIYKIAITPIKTGKVMPRPRSVVHVSATAQLAAITELVKTLRHHGKTVLIVTATDVMAQNFADALSRDGIAHRLCQVGDALYPETTDGASPVQSEVLILKDLMAKDPRLKLQPSATGSYPLHVIIAERQESSRLDRYILNCFLGLAANHSLEVILSWEDSLLATFGQGGAVKVARRVSSLVPLFSNWIGKSAMRISERKREQMLADLRQRLMKREQSLRRTFAFTERME